MEAKYTPGPWRRAHVVSAYERKRRVIIAAEESQHAGVPVCEVYGVNDEDCVANAKLIAAAPTMLAALVRQHENIQGWLDTGEPAGPEESKDIAEQIESAINLATGTMEGKA